MITKYIIGILSILLLTSVTINVFQYNKNKDLSNELQLTKSQLLTANSQIENLNTNLNIIQDNIKDNQETQLKHLEYIKESQKIKENSNTVKLDTAEKENKVINVETSNEYKKLLQKVFNN